MWYNTRKKGILDMAATRRTAREWAIQMLTAADLNPPSDVQAFLDGFWRQVSDLDEEDGGPLSAKGSLKAFAEERVAGVLASRREIDGILEPMLDHWDLYRLGTVERAVLRLGIWEMRYSDVPKPVVINEAVDLVNWFSSPKSRQIVNGVLDKYAHAR